MSFNKNVAPIAVVVTRSQIDFRLYRRGTSVTVLVTAIEVSTCPLVQNINVVVNDVLTPKMHLMSIMEC